METHLLFDKLDISPIQFSYFLLRHTDKSRTNGADKIHKSSEGLVSNISGSWTVVQSSRFLMKTEEIQTLHRPYWNWFFFPALFCVAWWEEKWLVRSKFLNSQLAFRLKGRHEWLWRVKPSWRNLVAIAQRSQFQAVNIHLSGEPSKMWSQEHSAVLLFAW